jgi:hypothetical protein
VAAVIAILPISASQVSRQESSVSAPNACHVIRDICLGPGGLLLQWPALTNCALPRSVHADQEVGVLRPEAFQNAGVDVDAEGVFLASLRAWRRRYDDGGGLSRYLVLRPPAAPDARMPASISALMSRRAVSSEQSASLA